MKFTSSLLFVALMLVVQHDAQAEDDVSREAEQAAAAARGSATKVRQRALRDCYKELESKALAGRARHEFMRSCAADKQKAVPVQP